MLISQSAAVRKLVEALVKKSAVPGDPSITLSTLPSAADLAVLVDLTAGSSIRTLAPHVHTLTSGGAVARPRRGLEQCCSAVSSKRICHTRAGDAAALPFLVLFGGLSARAALGPAEPAAQFAPGLASCSDVAFEESMDLVDFASDPPVLVNKVLLLLPPEAVLAVDADFDDEPLLLKFGESSVDGLPSLAGLDGDVSGTAARADAGCAGVATRCCIGTAVGVSS